MKIKYQASLVAVTFEGRKKISERVVKKVMNKSDLDMLDFFMFPHSSNIERENGNGKH